MNENEVIVVASGKVFIDSLVRNYKQIRTDRARAIAEDTQLAYRRAIEDMELELRKMSRERENMLDLSPTTTTSLVPAGEFDHVSYVKRDIELGVKIRQCEIVLEVAKRQYGILFGGN